MKEIIKIQNLRIMTAQAMEVIKFKDEYYCMATEPLAGYLKQREFDKNFEAPNTALRRGYHGEWAIDAEKLFFVALRGFLKGTQEVKLDYLFPGEEFVFAEWFTGELRLPVGNCLNYVHGGYASLYEKDIFVQVEKGRVISTKTVDNREYFMQNKEKLNAHDIPF